MLKDRITSFRDCTLLQMSRSPFLISYVLLIIPLHLLGIGLDSWDVCHGYGNNCGSWHIQDWHLNLLAIFFAALVQPSGSLLLAPAFPPQTVLNRLNPLVCMAEGISTLFTLLSLHFSRNTLPYPAAATLTLYLRETSSLTPPQLEQLSSYESNKPNYTAIRESLGFSSLEPRNISASASLYVFGLLALIRFMLNKWLYADARYYHAMFSFPSILRLSAPHYCPCDIKSLDTRGDRYC
jgi:hypothetical protein